MKDIARSLLIFLIIGLFAGFLVIVKEVNSQVHSSGQISDVKTVGSTSIKTPNVVNKKPSQKPKAKAKEIEKPQPPGKSYGPKSNKSAEPKEVTGDKKGKSYGFDSCKIDPSLPECEGTR
jgi:hypothetical protein